MGKVRFFPEELNTMSFEERKEHKERLLRKQVQYVYDNSPEYYQLRFKECGAEPGDIKTIEDLHNLPVFMDKDRERQSMETSLEKYGHPFGLHICCDPMDIISTGGTSGTTGHPTYPYTTSEEDYKTVTEILSFLHTDILGLGKGDRAFFSFPLGVYATSAILPALTHAKILPLPIDIRLGTGVAMELVKWTKPTFMWTGAAIAEFYANAFKTILKVDPKDLGFKCLVLTGEIGCGIPEMKKRVEDLYGCRWYDFWGPSLTSVSVSCDSDEYYGLHKYADDWDISYEDLIDPQTHEHIEIKDGAIGEIVSTQLRKQGSPYLKYATGDIVQVFTSECPGCGFKGYRAVVVGRSDDMLTVKGVNVFGRAIRKFLQQFIPRITGSMRIIKEDPSSRLSILKVRVEYAADMKEHLDDLTEEIKAKMKADLRVNPQIEWAEPESLKSATHKQPLFEKRY